MANKTDLSKDLNGIDFLRNCVEIDTLLEDSDYELKWENNEIE